MLFYNNTLYAAMELISFNINAFSSLIMGRLTLEGAGAFKDVLIHKNRERLARVFIKNLVL